MKKHFPPIIFLMGPTGSGKTNLVISLYRKLPIKIISVDSALIYRDMNIGTAKPNMVVLSKIPHKLINIRDPKESYSVANFYYDVMKEIKNITSSNHIPLLVGGTMLYFNILIKGLFFLPTANNNIRMFIKQKSETEGWNVLHKRLQIIDPITANRIHPNDSQRITRALEIYLISGKTVTELTKTSYKSIKYNIYQFSIMPTYRELLHKRIEQRFYNMLNNGFEEEVNILFSRTDLHKDMPSMRCVGYRQMWSYLSGEINYNEMVLRGIYATKQLAKRQITWIKNWPTNIHWLDINNTSNNINIILKVIQKNMKI